MKNSSLLNTKLNNLQYSIISIIDNYLIIVLYFKILNFFKNNISLGYSYDDEINKIFIESVSNERLKKLEYIYPNNDIRFQYLNYILPISVLMTGLTCTILYSPIDYIIQSKIYNRSFNNNIFVVENYQKIVFTVVPNFFRFSAQYGIVYLINEIFKTTQI